MKPKKISLFLIAVLTVILVFTIPFYNNWATEKFGGEADRMYYQMQHLTTEERMETRFGPTYTVMMAIKQMLNRANVQDGTIFLPPNDYIRAMRAESAVGELPEPAIVYYFTGYKAVRKTSPNVRTADWALVVQNHKLALKHINYSRFVDSLLVMYKPYKQ